MIRVPVLSTEGIPLMPTKASRARRLLKAGKAKIMHNDLGIFCIQLLSENSAKNTQTIAVGIDPGKNFSGIGIQSRTATLFMAHLLLPFAAVTKKMTERRDIRQRRRRRRINRRIPFSKRCHRQKRFDNRKQSKLPPSIRANRHLELRVVKEVFNLFPVSVIVYEVVKAPGNKGFSPVMVGQNKMVHWLEELVPVITKFGWETSLTRQYLKLEKNKSDKSVQSPETHAHDGVALAATQFVQYERWESANAKGANWFGSCHVTKAPFRVIGRANYYRRQLHFENPDKNKPNPTQYRKRKGGTVTHFGFRYGDLVIAEKAGKVYRGWVGGWTNTQKTKRVSVYDINWKRIGSFVPSKVKILQRKTGLLVSN